jgi:hypothetical protein
VTRGTSEQTTPDLRDASLLVAVNIIDIIARVRTKDEYGVEMANVAEASSPGGTATEFMVVTRYR